MCTSLDNVYFCFLNNKYVLNVPILCLVRAGPKMMALYLVASFRKIIKQMYWIVIENSYEETPSIINTECTHWKYIPVKKLESKRKTCFFSILTFSHCFLWLKKEKEQVTFVFTFVMYSKVMYFSRDSAVISG